MRERNLISLVIIIALSALSLYIALPVEKPDVIKSLAFWQDPRARDLQIKQGLDLKGGLQVLLTTSIESGQNITGTMETARNIIERRVNSLGTTEASVQLQGSDRILVELPGVNDRQLAIELIQKTGLLEFVDGGFSPPPDGTPISTTYSLYRGLQYPQTAAVGKAITDSGNITNTADLFQTAFTGEILENNAQPQANTGQFAVNFSIKPAAQKSFEEYTGKHIRQPLCMVLDGRVLSCPIIQGVLNSGGQITGRFTAEEARALAVTLNYGSLPIPMKIDTVRDIGATLGAESVRRSVIAGIIGLSVLALFLILYYRLPGLIGAFSLVAFALFSLALFVLMPITLTLPGIAGFLLSIATAVDANILVFERFKEELRGGRTLRGAVESAFNRAWSSIRDSNVSTLLTCVILFLFGNVFGASAVKGFAINLIMGIMMSLFVTMFVTRTLMRLAFYDAKPEMKENKVLLGI
ncbi:MAG: protein translocase subunit SecD [Anaerolineae bacterium]|nr:protein translocase subunit SecD [Anaerolineae bacterium]